METSAFIEGIKVHDSWKEFLDENTNELLNIEKKIGNNYTPSPHRVLRFLETDLKSQKVIIYGRDPYPDFLHNGEPVATGRSFEVNGLSSWEEKRINRSLQHILRVLYKNKFNLEHTPKFVEIRERIISGDFLIPSPDKLFNHWEEQGVLFLNCSFTTFKKPGKHERIWKPFFDNLLRYICKENKAARHFLWGARSKKLMLTILKNGIEMDCIYCSYHPAAFKGIQIGYQNNNSFFTTTCFRDTQHDIKWV